MERDPMPDVTGYLEKLSGSHPPDRCSVFMGCKWIGPKWMGSRWQVPGPEWIRQFYVVCEGASTLLVYKCSEDAMALNERPLDVISCRGATVGKYIMSDQHEHADSTFAINCSGRVTYLRAGYCEASQAWVDVISAAIEDAAKADEAQLQSTCHNKDGSFRSLVTLRGSTAKSLDAKSKHRTTHRGLLRSGKVFSHACSV